MALSNWAAWILNASFAITLIWLAWHVRLRWWPSLVLRLLIILGAASAIYAVFMSEERVEHAPEVLVIDRSHSILEESMFQTQVFASYWQTLRPNRQVILYGGTTDYVLSETWPGISGGASDLGQALEMAEGLLGSRSGRIIIASDGNVHDPAIVDDWISRYSATSVEMDFIQLEGVEYDSDASLQNIKGTTNVWSGMRFPVFIPVHANLNTKAVLQVFINGVLYNEGQVNIEDGATLLPVMLQAGNPGVMQVEARIQVENDQFGGNNATFASIRVYPQPKILIITKNQDVESSLASLLSEQESEVTVMSPEQFPTRLDALEPYQVIMVHDLLAQDLSYEQMQAIRLHVLELGKGLVFLGGRNSFTLGGYQNTLLEPLMPIILAPPDRVQRVPITFLLVLDRSGSMAGDRDTEIAPIDLTREAAMRAIETLRSDDFLGVLSFSGTTSWEVELRQVGEGLDLRIAQDKVSQIVAVGGTFMYQALEEAVNKMVETETTDYPHILLMSDGVSGDGSSDEFDRLVEYATRNGVTISTIALGNESDPVTLSRIAALSGGRFYQVYNPADLPRVMISESRAVQAENVQEGRTNLILGVENHPVLAGFSLDELPLMNGYIATQSKSQAGAEDVLLSGNFGDPVLSVWQVGLGHIAAWMGDMGELWVPGMKDWQKQGIFWQQLARYTLPDPSNRDADISIVLEENQMTIQLSLSDTNAKLLGSTPIWVQSSNAEKADAYRMSQVRAGVYQLVLPKPQPGAYTGIIQYLSRGNEQSLLVPFAVNYPDEWRFDDSEKGIKIIDDWREQSNGSLLSFDQELENSRNLNLDPEMDWFKLIVLILIIGWPLEIAIRRWQMPWRRP